MKWLLGWWARWKADATLEMLDYINANFTEEERAALDLVIHAFQQYREYKLIVRKR